MLVFIVVLITLPAVKLYDRVLLWKNYDNFYQYLSRHKQDSTDANIELAVFHSNTGNTAKSLEYIKTAQALNPLEPGIVFAEASIRCFHMSSTDFTPELKEELGKLDANGRASSYYILQYRKFAENCGRSAHNHAITLSIHERLIRSSNKKIKATAHYGIGLVYLYKRNYQMAITEWEKSLDIADWLPLRPEIERLQRLDNIQ